MNNAKLQFDDAVIDPSKRTESQVTVLTDENMTDIYTIQEETQTPEKAIRK